MKSRQIRASRTGHKRELPATLASRVAQITTKRPDVTFASSQPARAQRVPTFKAASLTFVTGFKMNVVLKNISENGARVEFVQDVPLPDRVFVTESTLNLRCWAYVAWQDRWAAGLSLVHPD